MDLGHPISTIAPPLIARVLEVLGGTTRPLTGREIGKIIGEGSPNGVWNQAMYSMTPTAMKPASGSGL